MGKTMSMSPLGLYNWDNTIFDLMEIPTALNKDLLVNNLLAETAELEVLYANPVVFKNLVALWSRKELDVWNKLYQTTQYEYNPIENYNRYETGSTTGTGSTRHTGTDTTTGTETNSGIDTHADQTTLSGSDTIVKDYGEGGTQTDNATISKRDGGTETESGTYGIDLGGTDTVTGEKNNAHYIAGYDSVASGQNDGLVKQTRDEETGTTTTTYGKTEDGESSKTTTFGKTENITDNMTHTFGKTVDETDTTSYGKTEINTGNVSYGKQVNTSSSTQHGEIVSVENDGEHTLHAHGNIGVTTTQEMIRQERSIDRFNLYDFIIESFKMRFCILVY